jgi:hypothetical protein
MKRNDLPDPARRRLLAGSAGVVGVGLLGAAPVVAAHNVTHWDAETDVLVVGTGAAGAAAAIFARQANASVLMIEKADYFGGTTAKSQGGYWIPNNHLMRARGLTDRAVHFGHALKNTLVPVMTITGLQLGGLIAFAIITETVFQWPGMGLLFIQAVTFADIPVMAAYLCLIALIFVAINLVVDLLYFAVDPRLRVEKSGGH